MASGRFTPQCPRGAAGVIACVWAIALAGCGAAETRPPVFPVKGQVFYESKPAPKAIVFFYPVEALDAKAAPANAEANKATPAAEVRPVGVVEDDGSFEVSTYGTKDGAPPGRYRVAIFWTKDAGGGDDSGVSLLPARYQDARNSGLPIIEVKSQPNVLPAFRLSR